MRSEQPQALHAIILGVATAVIGYALYELLPVTGFWLISMPWEGLKISKIAATYCSRSCRLLRFREALLLYSQFLVTFIFVISTFLVH